MVIKCERPSGLVPPVRDVVDWGLNWCKCCAPALAMCMRCAAGVMQDGTFKGSSSYRGGGVATRYQTRTRPSTRVSMSVFK